MKKTVTAEFGCTRPKPVMVTIGDVTFPMGGAFAVFYRWAEFSGILEQFLEEMKPYYWKKYQDAYKLQRAKEERRFKRMLKQNSGSIPEPAVSAERQTFIDKENYTPQMITDDMEKLSALRHDLRSEKKRFNESVKPLKDEIRLLEASIIKEVLEAGKSITVGDIRAEYKPTVVISMKKETNNE